MGSTGDIQPYLALATALERAGHEPYLVAGDAWQARAREVGVRFRSSGNTLTEANSREMMARVLAEPNPLRQAGLVFEGAAEPLLRAVPGTLAAIRDADVVVCHSVDFAGLAAAEALGKPHLVAHVFPGFLPGQRWNPTGIPRPRPVAAAIWAVTRLMLRRSSDAILNRVRAAAGLAPGRDLVLAAGARARRTLLAVSPAVLPPDPDWQGRVDMTGFWYLDEPSFAPDPELARFLDAGEPPVVVTFGSMMGQDVAAATRAVLDGLRAAGRRAVIQAGSAGIAAGIALPRDVLRIAWAPHGWLLPRAACVVHHGGAGTTAAVLRAGVPQVIVWHMGDQPAWGAMIAQRGLGPRPRSHRRLTGKWLGRALQSVLADDAMTMRARALAATIATDEGVERAVKVIESSTT
jgi:UDP:flavonoid glycosyltransferase YjiC (YdhE family)